MTRQLRIFQPLGIIFVWNGQYRSRTAEDIFLFYPSSQFTASRTFYEQLTSIPVLDSISGSDMLKVGPGIDGGP